MAAPAAYRRPLLLAAVDEDTHRQQKVPSAAASVERVIASLVEELGAREQLVSRLGSAPEGVRRAALAPSDARLAVLLRRLGTLVPPEGKAALGTAPRPPSRPS